MSWLLVLLDHNRRQHVIPIGDGFEHEEAGGCPCGPDVKRYTDDGGQPFTIWTHHPLSGRDS
jgi:hypothetical protein